MSELFGQGWSEIIMQQQIMSFAGTLISINAQREAYDAEKRRFEMELDYARQQFEFQKNLYESRHGEKMK